MLDIFLLDKTLDKKEDSPSEKNYLTSFTLNEFRIIDFFIKYANKKGISLSFFSDFEIPYAEIDDILSLFDDEAIEKEMGKKNNQVIKKLRDALIIALSKKSGIIGVAD